MLHHTARVTWQTLTNMSMLSGWCLHSFGASIGLAAVDSRPHVRRDVRNGSGHGLPHDATHVHVCADSLTVLARQLILPLARSSCMPRAMLARPHRRHPSWCHRRIPTWRAAAWRVHRLWLVAGVSGRCGCDWLRAGLPRSVGDGTVWKCCSMHN